MENVKQNTAETYRVSANVILTLGTKFRASGGPYYEIHNPDGTTTRVRMRDRGPFLFLGYQEYMGRKNILAFSSDGFTVLNVGPLYRHPDLPGLVKAPYRNIRRVGVTRRQRASRQLRGAA